MEGGGRGEKRQPLVRPHRGVVDRVVIVYRAGARVDDCGEIGGVPVGKVPAAGQSTSPRYYADLYYADLYYADLYYADRDLSVPRAEGGRREARGLGDARGGVGEARDLRPPLEGLRVSGGGVPLREAVVEPTLRRDERDPLEGAAGEGGAARRLHLSEQCPPVIRVEPLHLAERQCKPSSRLHPGCIPATSRLPAPPPRRRALRSRPRAARASAASSGRADLSRTCGKSARRHRSTSPRCYVNPRSRGDLGALISRRTCRPAPARA